MLQSFVYYSNFEQDLILYKTLMLKKLQIFVQKVLNTGITDNTPWSLANKVQVANALIIIAAPLLVLNFITNIFQQDTVGLILCLIWAFLAFITLFLNERQYFLGCFIYIVGLITIMSDLVYIVLGPLGNVAPMYMLGILMVLFFFDNRKHVLLLISIIIINFIVTNYVILNYDTVIKEPTISERFLYFTFSVVIMIGITLRVLQENRKHIKETETLLKELEQKNEATERFAYITSHDLKEPLRNIASFSGLLARKLDDSPDEEVKEYLGFIKSSAIQLNTLADSVQEYVNISNYASDSEFQTITLSKIVHQATQLLANKITAKRAVITCSASLEFIGSEHLFVILFQHLIDNAIKFNQHVSPTVIISGFKTNEEYILSVRDNGMGIEKDYFQQIFIPFKKLHNKSEYEGAGVGLPICQRIAELHQGHFIIKSEIGCGSEFILYLPKNMG